MCCTCMCVCKHTDKSIFHDHRVCVCWWRIVWAILWCEASFLSSITTCMTPLRRCALCDHHMPIVCSSHDLHMTITWSSHDYHLILTWQSHDYHMPSPSPPQPLVHNSSEKVRIALLDLLLLVKGMRTIKFWHICPIEHLLGKMDATRQ